jgi:hypothetical protein
VQWRCNSACVFSLQKSAMRFEALCIVMNEEEKLAALLSLTLFIYGMPRTQYRYNYGKKHHQLSITHIIIIFALALVAPLGSGLLKFR